MLENLLCIPCTDPILGQVGCQGECDSSDYSTSDLPIVKNVKKDIIISKDYAMNAKKVLLDAKNALMLMRKLTKAKDLNVKNV